MVNFFEISVNILEMFIVLLFLTLYFGSKFNRIKMIGGFLLGLSVAVATITYLNSLYVYESFSGLIFILIYVLYSHLFLKGDFYTKLFMSGFINCIVYFLALFSSLCVTVLFKVHSSQIYAMTYERLTLIVMSKILLIASCIVLLKFKFPDFAKKRNMIVLIVMPIVADLSMVGIMQAFLKYSELKTELLLASVSVMLANVLTYYVFIKINKDAVTEAEFNAIQQKYENDRKNAQDIKELYSKTCGLRHDLLIHFSTILKLLEESKDRAKEYIETVTHNQLDEMKNFIKTDNECFDAIVNAKIALCDKLGIKVQTRIMNNVLSRLKNDEIAILFGNLFDNAIDASKNSAKKSIQLDVQKQGAYLSILMINSIDTSVLADNKELNTTKENKKYHGFGTKNIQRIVKLYRGMMNYYEEDGYFCCDILLL